MQFGLVARGVRTTYSSVQFLGGMDTAFQQREVLGRTTLQSGSLSRSGRRQYKKETTYLYSTHYLLRVTLRREDAVNSGGCLPSRSCSSSLNPAEHEGNGPKMLEIAKKRCGEACSDIDLASDRAFSDAKAFQDKYWRGTQI